MEVLPPRKILWAWQGRFPCIHFTAGKMKLREVKVQVTQQVSSEVRIFFPNSFLFFFFFGSEFCRTLKWNSHGFTCTNSFFFKKLINLFLLEANYFTILWWSLPYTDLNQPWVYMCPHPKPPSHLSPHPTPLGCPSALALSDLFHALNLDRSSISQMVIHIFQC